MITLYHGSYIVVSSPFVGLGRKKVDFGQGFYLTNIHEQAKAWAETIAERKGRNTNPIVSAYTLDYETVKTDGFRVKIFDSYNLEWLEYVVDCRRGGEMQKQYDIVEVVSPTITLSTPLRTTRMASLQQNRHSVSCVIRKSIIKSAYSIRR